MAGGVAVCGLAPHPAILVPQVGHGEERKVAATLKAMGRLGQTFTGAGLDALVVITPHGPVFRDAVSIRAGAEHSGDLSGFGAPEASVRYPNDPQLVEAMMREAEDPPRVPVVLLDERVRGRHGIGRELDHGAVVPLYFLAQSGFRGRLVVVNIGFLSMLDLYRFGAAIERACRRIGRRVGVLASGDLSHRLARGAPAGFSPKGAEFDEKLVKLLKDFEPAQILTLPGDLVEEAGECGLRPVAMMLGALDRAEVSSKVLSYEGPFGVGYAVGLFTPKKERRTSRLDEIVAAKRDRISNLRRNESFPVSLAREAAERYVSKGEILALPGEVPEEFKRPGGVLVSIHREGALRGCIGTTEGTTTSLAEEIITNAIAAATGDPRFEPVEASELDGLDYSVDVLSPYEPVEDESELDPKVYGIICEKGRRRGLLLPDLPGVDQVSEQVSIARRKAGIAPGEKDVGLYRFTVTRFH